MTRAPELSIRGEDRKAYGAIFSLRHAETGETTAVHLVGARIDCARRIAALIDATGEAWRVVCVSTPESIYRDLQGSRNLPAGLRIHPASGREISEPHEFEPLSGERQTFGRIGRLDLLPVKRGRRDDEYHRRQLKPR
jgi:hypothetical protein